MSVGVSHSGKKTLMGLGNGVGLLLGVRNLHGDITNGNITEIKLCAVTGKNSRILVQQLQIHLFFPV
jgi:hypothetical protein